MYVSQMSELFQIKHAYQHKHAHAHATVEKKTNNNNNAQITPRCFSFPSLPLLPLIGCALGVGYLGVGSLTELQLVRRQSNR